MSEQQLTPAEVAQRMVAGETPAQVFGVTDDQIKAIVALGYNNYQQGKLDAAYKLFRGAATFNPKSYLGFAGAGAVALARKPADLDAAFENLSKAAELNPNDATILANLGEVLLRQGKINEAKEPLEKAFSLDTDRKDPGVNRARALVATLDTIVKEAQRIKSAELAKAS